MTRVYLAATTDDLVALASGQPVEAAAYGVTAGLAGHIGDDVGELEYAALNLAAEASARRGRHRIVVAADVEAQELVDGSLGAVRLAAPLRLNQVVSFHLGLDGDSGLAWYATQELDDVLAIVTKPTS